MGREDSTASIVHGDTSATGYRHGSANAQALGILPDAHPDFEDERPDFVDATPRETPALVSPRGAHFSPEVRGLSMVSNTTVVAAPTPSKPLPSFDPPKSPSPGPSAPPIGTAPPGASAPPMAFDDPIATRTPITPLANGPLPPGFVATGFTPSPSQPTVVLPPPPIIYSHSPSAPAHYLPAQPPPPELTPQMIAKVQRHCRFAVSALDYEDGEQARKELRAALALLGG